MPARNYYLNESDKDVVDAYVEYITRVMRNHGLLILVYILVVFYNQLKKKTYLI